MIKNDSNENGQCLMGNKDVWIANKKVEDTGEKNCRGMSAVNMYGYECTGRMYVLVASLCSYIGDQ